MTTNKNQRIAISLGDPAGIGIEVTLKALGSLDLHQNMQPLLVGCKQTVENIYTSLKSKGVKDLANPNDLIFEDIPYLGKIKLGMPNKKTGHASFIWLTHATQLVLKGNAKALVTAPISKYFWNQAGYNYPGQTERLGELTKTKSPSMLFTAKSPHNGWRLNTLLATTHIPLNKVATKLTPELIFSKLNVLLDFCLRFNPKPTLFIAGLNPHAGEQGKIGSEEINWMIPIIEEWRQKNPNILLKGPIPPDTCWISSTKAWNNFADNNSPDGILALYHDQGLIPVKMLAFDLAVNTTLGMPFIRTSPDHGTAFDIADKGIANAESMLAALHAALELSN
tara:strand:+ start:511 stop:1521 length:1011 start_codon:yes stop_codon:yes gene_type:complete